MLLSRPSRAMTKLTSNGVHAATAATRTKAASKFPEPLYPIKDAEYDINLQMDNNKPPADFFKVYTSGEVDTNNTGPMDLNTICEIINKMDYTKAPGTSGLRLSFLHPLLKHGYRNIIGDIVQVHAAGALPDLVRD